MTRGMWLAGAGVVLVAWTPGVVGAEVINFKLMQNQSRATFKSDAPLETFVGTAAGEGINGTLSLDPARPQAALATVKVDMNKVATGIEQRDADMRSKRYLDTEAGEANRLVTFEIKGVEVAGALEPGKPVPAKVKGVLTVKGKAVERVVDAQVTWVKLTPEQFEAQKRFGFTQDNVKVRAKFTTTFTDHGIQVPALLYLLKVANELQLEADLTFIRE